VNDWRSDRFLGKPLRERADFKLVLGADAIIAARRNPAQKAAEARFASHRSATLLRAKVPRENTTATEDPPFVVVAPPDGGGLFPAAHLYPRVRRAAFVRLLLRRARSFFRRPEVPDTIPLAVPGTETRHPVPG
jgi:hypothetical protein